MENFNVFIPEDKVAFFKSLIENLGFEYSKDSKKKSIEIPEWQKLEVNERYAEYKKGVDSCSDLDSIIASVEKKYEL